MQSKKTTPKGISLHGFEIQINRMYSLNIDVFTHELIHLFI
jgi:hypothetical protein